MDAARRALVTLPLAAAPLAACLDRLAEGGGPAFRLAAADARRRLRAAVRLADRRGDVPALAAAHRLGEVLDLLLQASGESSTVFAVPEAADGPAGSALIAGLRAVISVLLAGGFWVATQWPAGPTMVSWTSVIGALLASRTNPSEVSIQTFRAAIWAAVLGGVCTFLILPSLSEFGGLACVLVPVILSSTLISHRPGRAEFGTFLPLLFITLVAPGNPMVYDLEGYLNAAGAVVMATVWIVLTYRLILPVDRAGEVRRLLAAFARSVRDLAGGRAGEPPPAIAAWEYRHHHRLARLAAWLGDGRDGARVLALARGRMDTARALVGMRRLLSGLPPDHRRQGELIVHAVGRLADDPARLSTFMRRSVRRLAAQGQADTGTRRHALLALAAWCQQIAEAAAAA